MENELSRVVDALPGLIWTALPDGRVDFVNRRWSDYTGLDGSGWQAAIHPEDLPNLLERWPGIAASGEPGEMEVRLRRADGTYRWFLLRISPMADASGQIVKWCGLYIDVEDRKRSEATRRAHWWLSPDLREHHFRSITDKVPALAALMVANRGVELVNRQTLEYFGATLEELKYGANIDRVHPDDLPHVLAISASGNETGQPGDFEVRLRRADGIYRWFHTNAFPLHDTEGRIALWYFLQTDIDDRKRAEALLAGEKRVLEMVARGHSMATILEALCRLVEATADGCYCSIVLVDPDGARLEHGAAPSLPASFVEAINGRLVNADSGPCAMAAALNLQIIASNVATETRWAADGWCLMALTHGLKACWSTPIASAAGKVLGVLAIYHTKPRAPTAEHQMLFERIIDIASIAIERAQSDAALKRSQAFLTEAQRLSSTGGFSWNVATNEIVWSDEVYRIFETEQAGPLTPEVTDARIHPEDLPLLYEKVDQARIDGKDFEFEYRLVMDDRSLKYLRTVFHRTENRKGRIEFVGAIQDVTERRRSEEAVAKLRSELAHVTRVTTLGALTASIAHEVNQPLSGIITNASTCLRMLAADPPNVEGARETARRTIRDGNRASDVILRLRALFAKTVATSETVDLSEAAQEVIALSRRELQTSRVIVWPDFADDLPPVTGDRVQLQQVILNLLLNAADAMSGIVDRPRKLVIRTERDGADSVRLTVTDSGVGFEPEGAEKLFDAFYTTKSGGMGMGLAVSRSIVESHHGRLWAQANAGAGASFAFSIPRSPEAVTSAYRPGAVGMPAATDGEPAMRER